MTCSYVNIGKGFELDNDAAWDYIHDGYLPGPRTVLKGRKKLYPPATPPIDVDTGRLSSLVQQALVAAMGQLDGTHRSVMFSGGFDSMLIACLAEKCGARVTALTVQFDDFNPLTVAGAVQSARKAGIDHHILHVKAVEFLSAVEELAGITDEPVLDLDLAVVYAALKKYDRTVGGDVIISGMGSDQWFGDESLKPGPGGIEDRPDLALAMMNVDAHQRAARANGLNFVFPFLSGAMLSLARSLPEDMKKDKKLLREMAVANMIPQRGGMSEVQVPGLVRLLLVKTYGQRAWPGPVAAPGRNSRVDDQVLRQVILGLWLEKAKSKAVGA
jgi:asparagine synthetase B (glutamine-hydrolysing)